MIRQQQLMDLVQDRIRSGEYALRGLPTERKLAEELGVNRLTVRRAFKQLVENGVLKRGSTNRLQIAIEPEDQYKQIALMTSGIRSNNAAAWINDLTEQIKGMKVHIRTIFYSSWDDLTLRDALDGMDGVFIVPRADQPPDWLAQRILNHACPTVALGVDWTHLGVPSLVPIQPKFITTLLDHLYQLGHRHIDCFHASGMNRHIQHRIERWRGWCFQHGIDGELLCKHHSNRFFAQSAREYFLHRFEEKIHTSTAVMCTTMQSALGLIRAMVDVGLKPGVDLSVCSIDGLRMSHTLVPSITALERSDVSDYLNNCLEWMINDGGPISGNEPMVYEQAKLFAGESTGPAPNPS